jgi:hypothetical protein
MKLHIQFETPTNGCEAVNILNRLTHDLDGKRLRPGQRWLLVDDAAVGVGMATVVTEPRTTTEHSASLMQPIIAYVRKNGVKRLMQTVQLRTGEAFHYASWMRWLADDPKKRMEPAIGTALAIAAAHERIKQEDSAAAVAEKVSRL